MEGILCEKIRKREQARDREVDELIAAGWGAVEMRLIPANWREVQGPDTAARRVAKQAVMREIRARVEAKKQTGIGGVKGGRAGEGKK